MWSQIFVDLTDDTVVEAGNYLSPSPTKLLMTAVLWDDWCHASHDAPAWLTVPSITYTWRVCPTRYIHPTRREACCRPRSNPRHTHLTQIPATIHTINSIKQIRARWRMLRNIKHDNTRGGRRKQRTEPMSESRTKTTRSGCNGHSYRRAFLFF